MTTTESLRHDEALARLQDFNRKQMLATIVMVAFAALAYLAARMIGPAGHDFPIAVASASAITAGICCDPQTYRNRHGSLVLAIALAAALWISSLVVLLISLFG